VTVTGAAQTRAGATTQFTAAVQHTTNDAVTWQVNGVAAGSAADGTISATGLYTAPATLPSPNTVTISAVSQAAAAASGSLTETLLNPVPTITAATASGATSVLVDVTGTNFVSGAQIQVGGTSLTTTAISANELQATLTPPSGTSVLTLDVLNPDPGSAASATTSVTIQTTAASLTAASRLLDQATFGPTPTDVAHVQKIGLNAYLTEQFATAPTVEPDLPNPLPTQCFPSNPIPCQQSEWWQAAMTGPDQLRQRVALALAEMFVVSTNSISPDAVIPYQNMLVKDAFGKFSTVLHDVTLSPAMGLYLNMLNSAKPPAGQIANENYPREAMQLFTIGLNLLNQDGTPQLDSSGNPIPAYTQAQVQAFARAYTGWTFASSTGGTPAHFPNSTPNYDSPMALVESEHDTTAKALLNGTTLPAGQTGDVDLTQALDNLFTHPNVGPFVCRQLIQHLVSSNPSPAYVGRVSAVFADNGSGVRGDLQAVLRAILLDSEARAGDSDPTAPGGHLREPILYLTGVLRGLGATNTDPTGYYGTLSNYSGPLSQKPYAAGSVFNFFPPDYVIPGQTGTAPEFSLENTASSVLRLTLANTIVYNGISGFKVDLSATGKLGTLAAQPGSLVDSLNTVFMHGQMPASMRTAIVNHISTLSDPAERARVATYLVITSSLYKIEH
jgi:uncharacterized protein (DUF1800 family)